MKTYNVPTTEIRTLVFNQMICSSPAAPTNSVTTGNEVLPDNTIGD